MEGEIQEIVTKVEVARNLRPGRYTQRDVDYRHQPETPLMVTEARDGLEAQLERFHHNYGAFLYVTQPPGDTPVADDRGAARIDMEMGQRQVERRLVAQRSRAQRIHFSTSAHDVAPGQVVSLLDHPREDLGRELLVLRGHLEGAAVGDWHHRVEATFADQPWHPPLETPKPRTLGIESATVVGSAGDDIHTDEFARVRVQFHWDREGSRDETSSCWVPVNQPWGGAGFGALNIPRVGQEVLIDFLGQDPDRPVVMGRVFTKTNPVPYALPDHKTVSGIRSQTSNQDPAGFLKQFAQQVIAAGKDAAQDAVMQALGQAAEQTFGDRMPPLAQLIPQAAGMLAKLAQPGGVSFPSPTDDDAPPPPLTSSAPSRTDQPFAQVFPEGVRMATQVLSGALASAFVVDAMALPLLPDPIDTLLGPVPSPSAVTVVPPPMPTPLPPELPRVEDEGAIPPMPAGPPLIPEVVDSLPDVPFPEVPMNLERLQAAMDNGFGAVSPSGATHLLAGSEVTLDDTLGSERLYVQAQRDHNIVARSAANTIVGGNRSVKVGTSDVVDVGGRQVERIGENRIVDVYANQLHVVRGSIEQISAEASQQFESAENHTTSAKVIASMAEDHLLVDCGGPPPKEGAWPISGLLMMPDFIMLDGPKLYLNPGQAALEETIATGAPPATADEQRAAAAAEAAAAEAAELRRQTTEATGILEDAWQNRFLYDASQQYTIFGTHPRLEEIDPRAYEQAWTNFRNAHPTITRGGFETSEFVRPE